MNEAAATELRKLLGHRLIEQVPFSVAVIDGHFRVVAANDSFREFFGNWEGRRCHEVFKRSQTRCHHCRAAAVFRDGLSRVSDETGIDRHGRKCHYVVHLAPLRDDHDQIRYVIEMTTDLTETRHWQRQYELLFERVPCFVTVIDSNYRVVRANEKFRQVFGEGRDDRCFSTWKLRSEPCHQCPATLTFHDGLEHTSRQVGVQKDGRPAHYIVTTAPLSRGEQGIEHVIEMAIDITTVVELENRLREAHDYYETLIRNAATGILALDAHGCPRLINPAARKLLEWASDRPPDQKNLRNMLPAELALGPARGGKAQKLPEAVLRTAKGREIPARLTAVGLRSRGESLGCALFMEDLREIKRLEREKLDAERLAAVGQTVAGLAHAIKNLLMGLEGGMYMLDTGLRRSDADRILKGWGVLQRNFEKMTGLVKDFLTFAKGRVPSLQLIDPNELARNMVELYREAARRQGVILTLDAGPDVRPAPLDPQGIETCLTNLISNAIDAVLMGDKAGGTVIVRTREEQGELLFEVADQGCGMDWETKGKVFTTFFTTKGGKGTGLGLLTTQRIIQEHGGRIDVESVPGKGSTFRICLPRERLVALFRAAESPPNRTEP